VVLMLMDMLNQPQLQRLCGILAGKKQWMLSSLLSSGTVHGALFPLAAASTSSTAAGCSRSSGDLMALWIATKRVSSPKASSKGRLR
jgi:hypothetical protein